MLYDTEYDVILMKEILEKDLKQVITVRMRNYMQQLAPLFDNDYTKEVYSHEDRCNCT